MLQVDLGEFIMISHLYKLNTGDIFSIDLKTFTKNPNLWNNQQFQIIEIKQIRPKWRFSLFHHYFNIPNLYKIWIVKIIFV